ncbi:hypothetical protein DPMN_150488 [Dreissena polymorpha]|uniref:Uncharacterized protein n=1 Tax=Dreissena polymorpha TaxID=45954 RepID=A0A9D4J241_DREPO|nr:hypothetical protein DPMN_150488 [Dreissena polymorpha]
MTLYETNQQNIPSQQEQRYSARAEVLHYMRFTNRITPRSKSPSSTCLPSTLSPCLGRFPRNTTHPCWLKKDVVIW